MVVERCSLIEGSLTNEAVIDKEDATTHGYFATLVPS